MLLWEILGNVSEALVDTCTERRELITEEGKRARVMRLNANNTRDENLTFSDSVAWDNALNFTSTQMSPKTYATIPKIVRDEKAAQL
jgi:hypothetical protein